MSALKIIFMGTPDFSLSALESLLAAGHEIVATYSQPPRKSGRGMAERLSPVHRYAQDQGIEDHTPLDFNSQTARQTFAAHGADVAVVVAYGLILPVEILAAPRHGCLNIHASLLPRWRGAAPIQRAIMAGDSHSGITIMQMDKGLDTGDMVLRQQVAITPDTNAGTLHDELAKVGGNLIVEALEKLANNKLTKTPQGEDHITYAKKITKAEGRIDWQQTATHINRQIRGLTPWPGAWFEARHADKSFRIKVQQASPTTDKGKPGEVLDDRLLIACGKGALRIEIVQRQGKSSASAEDFLRGFAIAPRTVLE